MSNQISNKISEWVTCSPMDFRGCDVFADRDAGLIGQGFRANGWLCKSVLLGAARDNDLPVIIRATRKDLEDPKWWKRIATRGIVFYNTKKLGNRSILQAARSSGLKVAINVDDTVIFDFHKNPFDFWIKLNMHKAILPIPKCFIKIFAGIFKSYLRRFNGTYRRSAAHLANADVITAVTPDAVIRLKRFLSNHGQSDAASRVHLIPHPTHSRFVMRGEKQNDGAITFVTVGRWDVYPQKRPDLLMGVIDALLILDSRFNFRIYGRMTTEIEQWHKALEPANRDRVGLHGIVPNAELVEAYQCAHIYLCVSAYESFLIAAAEAMCCGCSIVACDSPTLPGPRWFASEGRGTLCNKLSTKDLVGAALLEADAWRHDKRQPRIIAAWAQARMHAECVARSYELLLSK